MDEHWKRRKQSRYFLIPCLFVLQVPDEYFTILLDYLQGLKGSARDTTVQKAEALMQELDGSDAEDPAVMERCERIRQVLQLLSWEWFCVLVLVWWRQALNITCRYFKFVVKTYLHNESEYSIFWICTRVFSYKYLSCFEVMKSKENTIYGPWTCYID